MIVEIKNEILTLIGSRKFYSDYEPSIRLVINDNESTLLIEEQVDVSNIGHYKNVINAIKELREFSISGVGLDGRKAIALASSFN